MRSFKSNENIHKKEDGSYYVVSANCNYELLGLIFFFFFFFAATLSTFVAKVTNILVLAKNILL